MKRLLTATALFAATIAGLALAQDAEKALKEIEGTYSLKALTKAGKSAPDEVIADFKEMVLKDGTITIKLKEKDEIAKIKIDPTMKPAHIDLTPTAGGEKDKTMKGIYKFEKETLTILLSDKEGDRPKDFKDKGDELALIVFERKKKE